MYFEGIQNPVGVANNFLWRKTLHMQFLNSGSSNLGTHTWDATATSAEREPNKDVCSQEASLHEVRRMYQQEHMSAGSRGDEMAPGSSGSRAIHYSPHPSETEENPQFCNLQD